MKGTPIDRHSKDYKEYFRIKYAFHKEEFLQSLSDYLESRDHTNKLYFISDKKYYYGLSFYEKMAEQFMKYSIDERLVQTLFDQKKMMLVRLLFLQKRGYITKKQTENFEIKTKDIIQNLEIIRNVILKNRMKYGEFRWPQHLKDELVKFVYLTKEEDYLLMKELYESIK